MQCFIIFFILNLSLLFAQTFNLSGLIRSKENNNPLSGVNIYIENSSLGTTSDESGQYIIKNIPASEIVVVYSYVGFAEKRVTRLLEQNEKLDVKLSTAILDGPIVSTVATRASAREAAISYSEINKKELDKRYDIQDIPELLSELPSTIFYSEGGNGVGYNYLNIRGFDQRRISVLINGIPQNDPEDHNIYWLDFPDLLANVQSVQVQRGAGNAFYGPAAIGGSINIKTDHFSPEQKFNTSFGIGSYNTKKYSAAYNSGLLGNKYIFNTRISIIKSDGYRERSWTNFWSYFLGVARYVENNNLRIHFYGGPIEDGLAYLFLLSDNEAAGGIPKFLNNNDQLRRKNWGYFSIDTDADSLTYFTNRRKDEIENFSQPHFEVLHEWQIDNRLSLSNNFSYISGSGFFDFDGGWGTKDFYRLTPEYGFANSINTPSDALIRAYVDNKQIGWFPQLTLKTDKGDMIIGAELRTHRSLHWSRIQKSDSLDPNLVGENGRRFNEYKGGKDIASLYLHQNYKWTEDIILQSDLQYTFKQYHLFDEAFIGTDFSLPYHFINPRIGLNYRIYDNSNAYFSMYSTTREPRLKNLYNAGESNNDWELVTPQFELNSDSSYNFNKPLVKPETLTGFEIGLNYSNEAFSGTVNFYYMDFKNEIIKNGKVDRFGQPATGNAKQTVHYGFEFSGKHRILPSLFIDGNISFSENKIKESQYFLNDSTYIDLKNKPIAGFPALLANLHLTYSWQELFVSISAKFVGESYTDNFKNDNHKLNDYSILNLSVNYNLKKLYFPMLTIQAKINNLLDRKYLSYGESFVFYPAATRNYFLTLKLNL